MASSHSAGPVSPPSTPTEQTSNRQLGLKQVYPGSETTDRATEITIVAIHGLDTKSPKTWTAYKIDGDPKSGQVHWLQDAEMLPSVFPSARIFTYDWNANFDEGGQTDSLLGHADKLLQSLHIRRSKDGDDRPIFFIASCFGGLLLCRALHRASADNHRFKGILNDTGGIMFIGTPFRGSGQAFMDVVNMRLAVAQTQGGKNESLVKYLRSAESEELDDIIQQFAEMANNKHRKIPVICLYETLPTDFGESLKKIPDEFRRALDNNNKAILVPKNSACLTGYPRSSMNARHNMLNKFSSPDDEGFQAVCFELGELVKESKQIVSHDESYHARNKIQRTLYVVDYLERMNRNDDPVKGTCDWFIGHRHFLKWREAKASSLLWVSANPGCGKSVLAKHLVRSLETSSTRTVCYFFFKDIDDQRNIAPALSSVLHQLFKQKPALLSQELIQHFESLNVNVNRSFDELWHILLLALEHAKTGEIVFVLDALDECELEGQQMLIKELRQFYSTRSTSEESPLLKLLVTSRPDRNVQLAFEPLTSEYSIIHLEGESPQELSGIEHGVSLFITEKVSLLQKKLYLSPEEESLLLKRLRSHRNQTYTWVYLTLKLIEKELQISKSSILELTSSLPPTINEVYGKILAKIGDNDKGEAKKLLQIVVAAKRPLTLQEMRCAIALQTYHTRHKDVEANQIPMNRFERYIRQLCGLFVNIIGSKIYLFHQTAKEFLIPSDKMEKDASSQAKKSPWKASLWPSESNRVISRICMQYLLFPDFETKTLDAARYCFFEYSATHWAEHFRASHSEDADVVDSVLRICDVGSLRCANWFRVYWSNSSTMDVPKDFTSLMIASYFGIERAVDLLLRKNRGSNVGAQDSTYQRTAISWASENGFDSVVKRLLKAVKMHPKNIITLFRYARDEVNSMDVNGRPALFYAIWNGHRVIVQTLIDAGADANLKDKLGRTPLSYALAVEQKGIVEMLAKAATEDTVEVTRRELLLSAVENDDVVILKRLIEAGASTENAGNDRQTLLAIASGRGFLASAKLLLQFHANIEARDVLKQTPLFYAARCGNTAVVQLLLHAGADIEAQNVSGRTPLFSAVYHQCEANVQLLLQAGANFEAQDINGKGLFSIALGKSKAIVELWLQSGGNVKARNHAGETPLFPAVEHGHRANVQFLLEAGADIEAQNRDGETPLFVALRHKKIAVAELLLQAGADIEAQNENGETPLLAAARRANTAAAQFLLQAGADIEAHNRDGETPLVVAIQHNNTDAVEFLLQAGANTEARNKSGETPLFVAVRHKKTIIAKFLLQAGANTEARNKSGETPIFIAARNELWVMGIFSEDDQDMYRNRALTKLLLEADANIEAQDTNGRTPLFAAVQGGREDILKLLLRAGANIEVRDKQGSTPLSLGYQSTQALLLRYRASASSRLLGLDL